MCLPVADEITRAVGIADSPVETKAKDDIFKTKRPPGSGGPRL